MIRYIENGTITEGLTASMSSYPLASSIMNDIPISNSPDFYETGMTGFSLDIENLSLIVIGEWTNRKIENKNSIILKRNNIQKKFKYIRLVPDYSLLSPTTKIELDPKTEKTALFDFIGESGLPSVVANVYFDNEIQNREVEILTYDYKTNRIIENGSYAADLSWSKTANVIKQVLRWRVKAEDWNYITVSTEIYRLNNLDNDVEYEWQIFASGRDKNVQYAISPVQTIKFY